MALATVPYGDTPGVADLPFDPRASFDPRTFPAPAATRPTIGRLRLPQPPLGARCLEVGFSLRVGGDVEAEASQCDVLDVPLLPRPRKLRLRSRSAAPAPLPARPTPVRRSPRAPPPHTSSSAQLGLTEATTILTRGGSSMHDTPGPRSVEREGQRFVSTTKPCGSSSTVPARSNAPTARLKAFLLMPNNLRISSGLDASPIRGGFGAARADRIFCASLARSS